MAQLKIPEHLSIIQTRQSQCRLIDEGFTISSRCTSDKLNKTEENWLSVSSCTCSGGKATGGGGAAGGLDFKYSKCLSGFQKVSCLLGNHLTCSGDCLSSI